MRVGRVIGFMVTRNEADRYLASALKNLVDLVDVMFVYDDNSDDGTPDLARDLGADVVVHPAGPSFLEHEGRFRNLSLGAMWTVEHPVEGDWILGIDADEALAPHDPAMLRSAVAHGIHAFRRGGRATGLSLPIREVWGFSGNGQPLIRQDGYWAQNRHHRLWAWPRHPEMPQYRDAALGVGATPLHAATRGFGVTGLEILHYGYAHPDDRAERVARYTGRPGHNPKHIESILSRPVLTEHAGIVPLMLRGRPTT